MTQFGRTIELHVNERIFRNDELTVYFDVPFDDSPFDNTCKLQIYNLSQNSINTFGKEPYIRLNAGYGDDVGSILLGIGTQVSTAMSNDMSKITTIEALDGSQAYYSQTISKTYRKGTKASQIIDDLSRTTGIRVGNVILPVDYVYKRGFSARGTFRDLIDRVAKDCGARGYSRYGQMFIAPKGTGKEIGFILNEDTGLLGTPSLVTQEITLSDKAATKKKISGYKIQCLLNHRIATDSIIQLQSRDVNGIFRVESGKHVCNGNDFITEMEVYPPGLN